VPIFPAICLLGELHGGMGNDPTGPGSHLPLGRLASGRPAGDARDL